MLDVILAIVCVVLITIIIGLYYLVLFIAFNPDIADNPVILMTGGTTKQQLLTYIGNGTFINQLSTPSPTLIPAMVLATYSGKQYLVSTTYDITKKGLTPVSGTSLLIDCSTIAPQLPSNNLITTNISTMTSPTIMTITDFQTKFGGSFVFSTVGKVATLMPST